MEREIKFRGLRLDGKGWVYGTYHFGCMYPTSFSAHYINDFQVDEKTIGQTTGRVDSEGIDIFEGDLIDSFQNDYMPTEVYYDEILAAFATQNYHSN